MSKTIFKTVDYNLGGLMSDIAMGKIGLPDIQRPFVWKNAKVRDLFDSMYRGYPVGYLLLWENGLEESSKSIGTESKQLPPSLVIVDGQQRLTSLYATIRNVEVLRKNLDKTRIRIAFNPLEERFEVADAAIDRDKSFLPDISVLWKEDSDLFAVVESYIEALASSKEVKPDDRKKIQNTIVKLQGLMSYPFTALQLDADISVENVSEVFVRINSKGKSLNQADFILTLMSVFWDEGRRDLEAFCRDARQPTKGDASPFNYFIDPEPDQLLRVCVGLGFKRARLQYVYSILRGIYTPISRTMAMSASWSAERKKPHTRFILKTTAERNFTYVQVLPPPNFFPATLGYSSKKGLDDLFDETSPSIDECLLKRFTRPRRGFHYRVQTLRDIESGAGVVRVCECNGRSGVDWGGG